MRESTQAKYRGLLDRHLLPTFGAIELSRVRPAQVAAWHSELAKRHPSTAAGAYRLLATIFNTAVRDEMILCSPCKVPGASQEHAAERPTATIAECQRAIDAMLPKYRAALRLAAWGQLRRSEVLALQRRNVDLANGTVKVERDWTVTEDGTTVLGPPKSDAGKRTLHLSDDATKALETHLATYVGPEPDAWLFPGRGDQVRSHFEPLATTILDEDGEYVDALQEVHFDVVLPAPEVAGLAREGALLEDKALLAPVERHLESHVATFCALFEPRQRR